MRDTYDVVFDLVENSTHKFHVRPMALLPGRPMYSLPPQHLFAVALGPERLAMPSPAPRFLHVWASG
jgi:hypothetical protein